MSLFTYASIYMHVCVHDVGLHRCMIFTVCHATYVQGHTYMTHTHTRAPTQFANLCVRCSRQMARSVPLPMSASSSLRREFVRQARTKESRPRATLLRCLVALVCVCMTLRVCMCTYMHMYMYARIMYTWFCYVCVSLCTYIQTSIQTCMFPKRMQTEPDRWACVGVMLTYSCR